MWLTGSCSASAICAWVTVISFGTPFRRSRPLISIRVSCAFSGARGGADFLLDALGRSFADQQVLVAADIGDDRFVHLVAAHAHRARIDDAAERKHGDFRRAAADIDDHGARRLVIGRPAPIAAAIGSSISYTRRAPAESADS